MSSKRVLISYFFGDDMIPLGASCADAFRRFGHEVFCFNSQIESRWEAMLLKPVNRLRPPTRLGVRQREVLQLVAEGRQNKEIAAALSISVKTVEYHKSRIMSRLDIHTATGLTRYALHHGILAPLLPR